MRTIAVALLALLAAVACAAQEDEMSVWDLRDTSSIEAIGWPDGAGSSLEARSGDDVDRIMLPGDVVVTGDFRVSAARDTALGDGTPSDRLRDLVVTYGTESRSDVLARAETLADRLGVSVDELATWAAADPAQPGGDLAMSGRADLDRAGVTAQLEAQALDGDRGALRLIVVWERQET